MKVFIRLTSRERKQYVLSCCIFLFLSVTASSQSGSPAYRLWEHPAIKAMERHDPYMVIYARSPELLVNLCIVDKLTGLAYYVSQYGYVVDTFRLATAQRKQLETAPYRVDPFHVYEASITGVFPLLIKAREFLRRNGDDFKKASPVLQEFFAFPSMKEAPSTLAKLLVIQEYQLEYANRLLDFNWIKPTQPVTIQSEATAYEEAGSLFIRGADSGYSEYTNKELLFAIRKARLDHASGRVRMYDWKNRLVDSFYIRKSSLKTLLNEKMDVFALYRAWLEWSLQQLNAIIPAWKYAASYELLKGKKGFIYSGLFNQNSSRATLSRLQQEKKHVLYKIDSLSGMDPTVYTTIVAYPRYRQFRETREWDGQHWKITPSVLYTPSETYTSTRGRKFYELTDHRGNVMATVTDKKIGIDDDGDGRIDRYVADIAYVTDYYPFGSRMPGRSKITDDYPYGYNGKENDNEVKGDGMQLDYGFRIYDSRIGKFMSVDPLFKSYPWYTPYQFAGDRPIAAIDLDGLEDKIVTTQFFSAPKLNNSVADKSLDPDGTARGINPSNDKEVVAAALILQAQRGNPNYNIPTNGQFVFWEFPEHPEKNSASYYVRLDGKLETFTVSPQILKQWNDELPKARSNLNIAGAVLNLAAAGSLLKTELKAASGELNAGAVEGTVLKGSGPVSGVLEVSANTKSVEAFKNYNPPEPIEFVYDPTNKKFLVGQPNQKIPGLSGHQQLVKAGSLNNSITVGGMFKRGANGEIITNEYSGHYYKNWTNEVRKQFKEFMQQQTGQTVVHNQ